MTKKYNHYIDGKKVATYKTNTTSKATRHALAHYRHVQRVAALKSLAATTSTILLFTLLAAATVVGLVGIN